MNSLALALRQVRYENTSFWRNPAAAFFTFVFPLMFLVIFNLVFGNRELDVPGGSVSSSTFYVPAIVALSVTSACYNNVAMGIAFSRDGGLAQAIPRDPTAGVVVPVRQDSTLRPDGSPAGCDSDRGRRAALRCGPAYQHPAGVHPSAGGRRGHLLRPWAGNHGDYTQRGCSPGHRQRVDSAPALHIGRIHPATGRPKLGSPPSPTSFP